MARPTIPFGCLTCGEWRPSKFIAEYKTLCAACRAKRLRERRAAQSGRPPGRPMRPVEPVPPKGQRASWIDVLMPDRRS